MNLLVDILFSWVLMITMFLYLVIKLDKEEGALWNKIRRNKKIAIYSIICAILMIGLSVEFFYIYPENTILHNLKILSLIGVLATACVTDLRERIIPNLILLIGFILRLIYGLAEFITLGSDYFVILKSDLAAVLIVGVIFFLSAFVVKNGVGMGDIKMAILMALYQGFLGVFSSLFVSLIIAFVLAVFYLLTRKKSRKDSMEFAPALFLGTFISVILTGQ